MLKKFHESLSFTGRTIAVLAAVLAIFAVAASIWVENEANKMDKASLQRYESYLLADELRQSSDDLTRLARTYVVTGNPLYEEMYLDILAIRNGEKERPENYSAIYWDFIAANMPASKGSGVTKPLLKLMEDAGFTQQEFDLLDQAAANSTGLVAIEVEAMNAVKGLFKDDEGNYTVKGDPNMERAIQIMHSAQYHRYKGNIMKPLNEFLLTMQRRFELQIEQLGNTQARAIHASEIAVGLLFILSIVQFFILNRRILGPLSAISATMEMLGNGEKVDHIPGLEKQDEIGSMARTTEKFRDSAEEALRLSEEVKAASIENERIAKEQAKAAEEVAEAGRKEQERMAQAIEEGERAKLFQQEIATVVDAYSQGDFSKRIDMDDKTGVFVEMCNGVNRIGEETETSLSELRSCLDALADGELDQQMSGAHVGIFAEMAKTLNQTCQGLIVTISSIKHSSDTITSSSKEVASTAESIAKRTERSAASLEEIASAIEELTASVKSTSNGAVDVRTKVSATADEANACAATARETAQAMEEVERSSQEIGNITKVIDEIAFQTNLLALNAGVEAARAGDAGRGFAVVASEVRALAQRSSEAANEINSLIARSENHVKEGVEKVNNSNRALERILVSVADVSDEIKVIADATTEQSSAISEISSSVNDLDSATQQNAAHMEETTAAAVLLREEADSLRIETDKFHTTTLDRDEGDIRAA